MLADRGLGSWMVTLAVVLVSWLAPARAHADVLDVEHDVLPMPGALVIAWCAGTSIWVGEWKPSTRAWSATTKIREEETCNVSLRLARSRAATILAIGDLTSGRADARAIEIVRLERSSAAFVETAATKLAAGFAPSLDASDDAIVVSSFEELPRGPEPANLAKPPPSYAKMHLRVLDPLTLAVVSGRTLYGHALLRPHQVAAIAGRALAIVDGTLSVAVPDDKPRMATFALPSLRPSGERVLSTDVSSRSEWFTSVVLVRRGARISASLDPPLASPAVKEALAKLP